MGAQPYSEAVTHQAAAEKGRIRDDHCRAGSERCSLDKANVQPIKEPNLVAQTTAVDVPRSLRREMPAESRARDKQHQAGCLSERCVKVESDDPLAEKLLDPLAGIRFR
jgi:hypothetical protein